MAFKIDRDAWYSSDETAELRQVSKKTLEFERGAGGGIAFSRIGKRIFYKGSDIEDYLNGRRQISTSHTPQIEGPKPRPKKTAHVAS